MGSARPRYWFPLALLGFVQLILAVVSVAGASLLYSPAPSLLRDLQEPSGQFFDEAAHYDSVPWDVSDYWPFAMALLWMATAGWYTYRAKTGYGRALAVTAGGILAIAVVEFVSYSGFGLPDALRDPLLVTAGLLLLAWLDRSVLVLAVAAGFLVAALLSPGRLAELLIPVMVVFAGAFAAVLKRPRPTADTP
ncbi:hypothetical protein [Amycolatopsis sp. H20-H5]|uniref:hypothetical protein n=1 Tax=Amycolatopsis sp. H20-H5 TaxID=3046309 RepID=UPI002DBC64DC|nr:hypothetical protein [Amycolatopsis sp. H20-H5]MEC3977698.1 hypothetical protein [Amycolatopsis sp. H20-H5]